MAQGYSPDAKIYPSQKFGKLSIHDMLAYFEEKGTMRVSDLHIKIGTPPLYRVDGNLIRLKGPPITTDIAETLIYALLSDKNLAKFASGFSVDSSYRIGTIQFRINVFKEQDGISAAIRALSLAIPPPEQIGFPNDVWADILNLKQGLVLVTGILFLAGYDRYKISGALHAYSAKDGIKRAQWELPGRPVRNGLAAATSKIYVSCDNGVLTCFSGQ